MKKRITDRAGNTFIVDFFEIIEDGKTGYTIECPFSIIPSKYHRSKVYYRHERTWDDHMGNTPCGYYVIVTLPYTKERRRVYMF